jgi:AraC-like DNA-binding protein
VDEVTRYETATGWYESTRRLPRPEFRPYVSAYWGFEERSRRPVHRLEVPYPGVIVMIGFEGGVRIVPAEVDPDRSPSHRSFVAGLHVSAARTAHDGRMHGVELALTPIGARAFLGVPMHELASRAISLDDVLGARAVRLAERLHEAEGWPARFELLERELAARLADAVPAREVAWAWSRLRATAGGVRVDEITGEVGWSRKRLGAAFREHVGLPPKVVARVLRFGHAVSLLRVDDRPEWGEIAHRCGYYDQAHFNRDFREFAGVTPTEFARRLSPNDPGVAA